MSDGVERDVIGNKKKLVNLMSIKIQLDEQEALGNIKINMKV